MASLTTVVRNASCAAWKTFVFFNFGFGDVFFEGPVFYLVQLSRSNGSNGSNGGVHMNVVVSIEYLVVSKFGGNSSERLT